MLYTREWPTDVKNSLESLWMLDIVRNSLEEALYGSVTKIKTKCSITGNVQIYIQGIADIYIYIYV